MVGKNVVLDTPQPLNPETIINTENDQHNIVTARNESLVNSYNPCLVGEPMLI